MLAKVWKKALLAVCIIACIYNVMHKLVTRTSLEIQLKSVQNQSSLIDIWKNNTKNAEENAKKENSSETNENNINAEKENSIKDDNTIVVIY